MRSVGAPSCLRTASGHTLMISCGPQTLGFRASAAGSQSLLLLQVAAGLMSGALMGVFCAARLMLFVGGPSTCGSGMIVTTELSDAIRSHKVRHCSTIASGRAADGACCVPSLPSASAIVYGENHWQRSEDCLSGSMIQWRVL